MHTLCTRVSDRTFYISNILSRTSTQNHPEVRITADHTHTPDANTSAPRRPIAVHFGAPHDGISDCASVCWVCMCIKLPRNSYANHSPFASQWRVCVCIPPPPSMPGVDCGMKATAFNVCVCVWFKSTYIYLLGVPCSANNLNMCVDKGTGCKMQSF